MQEYEYSLTAFSRLGTESPIIRNIKFRKIRNTPREKLKEDIKLMKEPNKTMTSADKTSNTYRLEKEQYDKGRRKK